MFASFLSFWLGFRLSLCFRFSLDLGFSLDFGFSLFLLYLFLSGFFNGGGFSFNFL